MPSPSASPPGSGTPPSSPAGSARASPDSSGCTTTDSPVDVHRHAVDPPSKVIASTRPLGQRGQPVLAFVEVPQVLHVTGPDRWRTPARRAPGTSPAGRRSPGGSPARSGRRCPPHPRRRRCRSRCPGCAAGSRRPAPPDPPSRRARPTRRRPRPCRRRRPRRCREPQPGSPRAARPAIEQLLRLYPTNAVSSGKSRQHRRLRRKRTTTLPREPLPGRPAGAPHSGVGAGAMPISPARIAVVSVVDPGPHVGVRGQVSGAVSTAPARASSPLTAALAITATISSCSNIGPDGPGSR